MDLSSGCFEKIHSFSVYYGIYIWVILYIWYRRALPHALFRPVRGGVVVVVAAVAVAAVTVVMSARLVHTKRNHLVLLHVGNFKKSNGRSWIPRCKKIVWGCVLGFHILNSCRLVRQTRCGGGDRWSLSLWLAPLSLRPAPHHSG